MGIVLSTAIKTTYVVPCVAFVYNDDLSDPGVDEIPFTARFKRRTPEEQEAYRDEIMEAKTLIDLLSEKYGNIDEHRQQISKEDPNAYKKLLDIEQNKKDILKKLVYEDWIGQTGLEESEGVDIEFSDEKKKWMFDFGHGEIRAALLRMWLSSQQGAKARAGN